VLLIKEKLKNSWPHLVIILFCFFLDRMSKIVAIDFFLEQKIESYYFNSFLNFSLIWNKGLAFGMLESDSYLYQILSFLIICIIIFLFFWLIKTNDQFEKFSVSLIIGGALGNFYDRVVFKAVPDFIDLHYQDFHWFVFNVSDIIITIGVLFLLLKDLVLKKNV
jgi:signal peptidase II